MNVYFIITYRSICEDCSDAKWKTPEEEEDKYQEMYTEPILQRIVFL